MAQREQETSGFRAKLVEVWRRFVVWNETEKIHFNGENNQYPSEIEAVIQQSPTASRAVKMMSKFIAGQGVPDTQNIVIDEKGNKLDYLIKNMADDVSWQGGSWVHVGYGFVEGKIKQKSWTVLDYTKCRKSLIDSDGNEGWVLYKDWSPEKKTKGLKKSKDKSSAKKYYTYNPNEDVVISQIKADAKDKNIDSLEEAIKHYRGQVFYLNTTPRFTYALSPFDPVYNDCDTEARISIYGNNSTRNGFLGKMAVITAGLDPKTKDQIEDDVMDWLGSENAGSIYMLQLDSIVDNLDEVFKIIKVEPNFNEGMFEKTIERCRRNILGQANNLPEALAFSNDGALYGGSGEAYKQAKLIYEEQNEWERLQIEQALKYLGIEAEIITLSKLEKENQTTTE